MAFCSSNTETISFTNFATVYTGTECLQTSGGFTSGVVNGIVDPTILNDHITLLLTTFAAIPPTSANQSNENQAATFATNAKKLRTALQTEYCYYYVRYKFGLEQVLTAATSQALSSTTVLDITSADSTIITGSTPATSYGSAKTTTVLLNKKLNELIQIMQKLQETRFKSLTGTDDSYYSKFSSSSADSLNGKLKAQQVSLAAQSALLQSGSFNDDVKQSMIDYTLEKNASSRNLLAVYGFMNIVAVGLLFYMYKASK
jgi:hypothetical protein